VTDALLFYYPTAFILGALHSFEPAHGKAVLVAYVVGNNRSYVHTLLFGVTIAVAHTFSIMLLGIGTWLAADQYGIPIEGPIIGIVGGLVVLFVGFWMLLRWRVGACPHPGHGHHDHSSESGSGHQNGRESSAPSLKQLLVIGVGGGLIPCPSGVAMLMTAVAAGNLGEGLGLAAAFSLGAGAVVIVLSTVMMRASGWTSRWISQTGSLADHMPMVGSLLVICVGVWLSGSAFLDIMNQSP
jgi:nickel/cobalt transporter (NicO) family protein